MVRNVVVEITHLLRKQGAGLGRKRLLSGLSRLRDAHDVLVRGAEAGRWPHLVLPDAEQVASAHAIAAALHARAPRLAVVGQPGAVAALRAITEALGVRAPHWVTSPDAATVPGLDGPDVAWLVLEGPAWVDHVAEWAVSSGRVVAVAGAGAHEAPPEGWWISDPVAGDGRFGGLGLAGIVCAAWAGVDVGALLAGARDMAAACTRPALFENPAYTLALSTIFVERDLGISVVAHLATSGRMEAFCSWIVRMWGAVLADTVTVEGVVRHTGSAGVAGVVGDEELLQVLLVGPRDKLVAIWDVSDGVQGRGAEECVAQVNAFQDLVNRENLANLRVRLPGLDARTLGAAVLLAQHAAVSASLFLDLDPLGLSAVTAWYAALERARADVDAAPRTA